MSKLTIEQAAKQHDEILCITSQSNGKIYFDSEQLEKKFIGYSDCQLALLLAKIIPEHNPLLHTAAAELNRRLNGTCERRSTCNYFHPNSALSTISNIKRGGHNSRFFQVSSVTRNRRAR